MKKNIVLLNQVLVAALLLCGVQSQASLKSIQDEMNAFQKPQVDSLRQVLEKDPAFSSEYKVYLVELKSLKGIKNPEDQTNKAIVINKKYRLLFENAMKKSKADPESTRRYAAKLTKKYSLKNIKYHIEPGEFLTYRAWAETHQSAEQPPAETEMIFSAPYAFEDSSRAGGGFMDADLENGEFNAGASIAFVGSFKNVSGLGDFVQVPWAARTIRVSARLPETGVYLRAIAGLAGSAAKGSSRIEILIEDGEVCVKEKEHGFVFAPVVWYAELTMQDTTILACEMQAPPANQDIVVTFQSTADVSALGLFAIGYANVHSNPDPIRVRLIE